ncbi:MAG TPA: class I SAM-dependent methyltransferase [candidate division Zixibacteria bacterium]|nr:class I SAM-dependent methyltransferase [candidate division Zixibacteria bacterium]MDD4918907.1 class I SAM-dependent methyltransferase [candidate division Zixibacteria bacterium]MDM7972254.1 class I SAM-dependent methyltransferase [candidate division Zixibacteria bacterium]HOD66625.1 class I SAM-dependent methyltransferase [candidate division Zixibacteria bacterium]HOZ08469.1 class I SAM-dependent methyltransferase [candidate division Zixibacteria bacterium]
MTAQEPWYEREDFWEWTAPFMFGEERFERAASSVGELTAFLRLASPAPVLDLCAGPGRFAVPLAAAGYSVTAVDRSRAFLATLTARARGRSLDIETVCCDMREFRREGAFEAVLNMYTSFGYFEDPEDDRRVLENVFSSLRPGGRLVMELHGRESLIRAFRRRDWEEAHGITIIEERSFVDHFTRLHNRWIVLRGSERREFEFDLRIYGASELCALLRSVGFASAEAYADFQGAPYDIAAGRLVALAAK